LSYFVQLIIYFFYNLKKKIQLEEKQNKEKNSSKRSRTNSPTTSKRQRTSYDNLTKEQLIKKIIDLENE
jgi:protein required for attachment to host cells